MFKVQVRRGPDGARVDYYSGLRLREARAIAQTVPPEGAAGIWNGRREIRAWYNRDAAGRLFVSDSRVAGGALRPVED